MTKYGVMDRQKALDLFDRLTEEGFSATLIGRTLGQQLAGAGALNLPDPWWNVTVSGALDSTRLFRLSELAKEFGMVLHIALANDGLSFQPDRIM